MPASLKPSWSGIVAKLPIHFCAPTPTFLMRYSNNGGVSWSAPVFVDASADDQFYPSITTDRNTQTISIAYLNNHIDPQFQHRFLVDLKQILPGSFTPTAAPSR